MRRSVLAVLAVAAVLLLGHQAAHSALAVTYAPGWNLVAGPAGSTFPGATAVYSFPPGAQDYIGRTSNTPSSTGYGYWAYYPQDGSPNLAANPSSCHTTIEAPAGQYFLAGNPSSTNSATVSGASVIYTFDPVAGYLAATSLAPGQGAWVMPDAGGVVTLDAGTCVPVPAAAAPAPVQAAPAVAPPVNHATATCASFPSQAAAQAAYRGDPIGLARLDGNHNGIACSSNPGPYDYTPPAVVPGATAPGSAASPSGPFIPYPGNGGGPTQCKDGTVSHSSGSGTCSHHGGQAMRIGHDDMLLAA